MRFLIQSRSVILERLPAARGEIVVNVRDEGGLGFIRDVLSSISASTKFSDELKTNLPPPRPLSDVVIVNSLAAIVHSCRRLCLENNLPSPLSLLLLRGKNEGSRNVQVNEERRTEDQRQSKERRAASMTWASGSLGRRCGWWWNVSV